jgi:hypothetical protein
MSVTKKVNDELLRQLEEAAKQDSQREIPVIVTVAVGADPATLEQKGLRIQYIFDEISAISGTLNAAAVNELAQLDQVEVIEYDGQVWALSDDVEEDAAGHL